MAGETPKAAGAIGACAYPSLQKDRNLEAAGYPVYVIVRGQKAMPPIGMMMGGLRVVDEYGNEPTTRALFLRATGYVAAAVPAGLGFAWAIVNRDRCGLHDLISGTRVVRE